MSGYRRFPWWTLCLFVATLFLSGCAIVDLFDDLIQKPHANDPSLRSDENSRVSAIRESKTEPSRRLFFKEVEVGKMPDGYLVKLTWTDDIQLVRVLCVNPQAAGCQRSETVPAGKTHPGYRRQMIVAYVNEPLSDTTAKIMAHEICHAVASSQNLQPDPCHNENGGRL